MCEVHLLALQECGAGESVEHASLVLSLSLSLSLSPFLVLLYEFVRLRSHDVSDEKCCLHVLIFLGAVFYYFLFLYVPNIVKDFTETFLHQKFTILNQTVTGKKCWQLTFLQTTHAV